MDDILEFLENKNDIEIFYNRDIWKRFNKFHRTQELHFEIPRQLPRKPIFLISRYLSIKSQTKKLSNMKWDGEHPRR